jgi:DNA-binding MarR family transcriptional regulator
MPPDSPAPDDPARTPEQRLSDTVSRLTRGMMRLAREEARQLGLSLPQLFLLGGLKDTGKIPASRWVEMMGISPSATTSLLDGLQTEGLIVRSDDPTDRRKVMISLTPKGRRVADRLKEEYHRRWLTLCDDIPPGELDSAAATLEKILARLRLPEGDSEPGGPAEPSTRGSG